MLSKQMSSTSVSRRWIEKAGGSERTIRLGRKRKGVRLCAKTTKLHGSQKEGSCACYTGSTEFLQSREKQPHQLFRKAEKIEVCSLVPLRMPLHVLYKRAQTHTHAENAKKRRIHPLHSHPMHTLFTTLLREKRRRRSVPQQKIFKNPLRGQSDRPAEFPATTGRRRELP
jgi:hypothetical protein